MTAMGQAAMVYMQATQHLRQSAIDMVNSSMILTQKLAPYFDQNTLLAHSEGATAQYCAGISRKCLHASLRQALLQLDACQHRMQAFQPTDRLILCRPRAGDCRALRGLKGQQLVQRALKGHNKLHGQKSDCNYDPLAVCKELYLHQAFIQKVTTPP